MSKSNPGKWTKAKRAELAEVMHGVVAQDSPVQVGADGAARWCWRGQRRTLAVAPDKIVITAQQATGGAVTTVYEGRDGDADQPHYRDNPDVAVCTALNQANLNVLPD